MARRISVTKTLSTLIATGRGERCESFISALRQKMIAIDPITGINKTILLKDLEGSQLDQIRIRTELYETMEPFFKDIVSLLDKSTPSNSRN